MKEETDYVECEFKLQGPASAGELRHLLDIVRDLAPKGFSLVYAEPRTMLDVYFDTPNLHFYSTGHTLRLRKRRLKDGWTANYKVPPNRGESFMKRREVRTTLKPKDVRPYYEERLPGLAASLAYEEIDTNVPRAGRQLVPTLYVVQHRERYVVRRGGASGDANHLNVFVDHVIAMDIRQADARPLIHDYCFDFQTAPAAIQFDVVEIEPAMRFPELLDRSMKLTEQVGTALIEQGGLSPIYNTKYGQAMDELAAGE